MAIREIRLLPPLAIARLGSSPEPLENYDLTSVGTLPRALEPAETLHLDAHGNLTATRGEGPVRFRDASYRIRPVAPFFELFARVDGSEDWVPVTEALLASEGLAIGDVKWSAHVGNLKIVRRTGKASDRIEAATGAFSDHGVHDLRGTCDNFLDGAYVPFGHVQFARPSERFAGLRLRFTPAHGKVYGPASSTPDPYVVGAVYDPQKGTWCGYREAGSPPNTLAGRSLTNPGQIFAGYSPDNVDQVSYGYVDDECDGVIEARIDTGGRALSTFARVAVGPPTFAPDSKPIRTVADELEQALLGPDVAADGDEVEAAREIVRRALETVRLMNTGKLNEAGTTRGVGMARMDILDYGRKSEPIFDPGVAEALAIRARHERVLVALESGSLVWFARILRDYRQVGDLTDEGRRRMPGMMRSADGRHLALTRRQVAKIRRAAEAWLRLNAAAPDGASASPAPASRAPASRAPAAVPVNRAAQLAHRAQGNPPNSLPDTAISNAYPGLEMDFRNVWRRIFAGITLHESLNLVVAAEDAVHQPLVGMFVIRVAGIDITAPVHGPNSDGIIGPLPDTAYGSDRMALEWSNVLADAVHEHQGAEVTIAFRSIDGKREIEQDLRVRAFFEHESATIARDLVAPGELTQSLCAPWQNDYRECACFYWAASRPDYVNVEPRADGSSAGNNWMQRDRTVTTPKVYVQDDWQDPRLLSHTDLVSGWEEALRFIIANQDEAPKT